MCNVFGVGSILDIFQSLTWKLKRINLFLNVFRHFYLLALQKVICYKLREVRTKITTSLSITLSGVAFETLRMNNKCVKTQSVLKFNFYLFEIYE